MLVSGAVVGGECETWVYFNCVRVTETEIGFRSEAEVPRVLVITVTGGHVSFTLIN